MAVVLAVQKWCPYLLGQMFMVHTHQNGAKILLDQQVVECEYQQMDQ